MALIVVGILGSSIPAHGADFVVKRAQESLVDAKALTIDGGYGKSINGKSFQQDVIVSHNGYQYLAYYDSKRNVCVARRSLPNGEWKVARFQDYLFQSNDAHNTISLGICSKDGTIHMAFDHHGSPLHYRVSQNKVATDPEKVEWNETLFGPIQSYLEKGKPIRITYPRFLQTPDGGLQFFYRRGRSGDGDRMLVDYDPGLGRWKNTRQIDSREGIYSDGVFKSSNSRCSYPNGYSYGPDGKLHTTWVWREGGQEANHDLMYSYSEDGGLTWKNNQGETLDQPARVDTKGITIAFINRGYGLMNTQSQAIDSMSRVHFIASVCTNETLQASGVKPGTSRWGPPEARRYHHYWRSEKGTWNHFELPGVARGRVKLFLDQKDNAFLVFQDIALPNHSASKPKGLIIMASSAREQWKDWKSIHSEKGPFVNEMLGDLSRWKEENVLSVIVQDMPKRSHESTCLRVLDFTFENRKNFKK